MSNSSFTITYEVVTPESAEHGDYAEHGWITDPDGASFRDIVSDLAWHRGCYVEASAYPLNYWATPGASRWLTFYKVDEDLETGAETSWSLHIPEHVTASSAMRIARYYGAYGSKHGQ